MCQQLTIIINWERKRKRRNSFQVYWKDEENTNESEYARAHQEGHCTEILKKKTLGDLFQEKEKFLKQQKIGLKKPRNPKGFISLGLQSRRNSENRKINTRNVWEWEDILGQQTVNNHLLQEKKKKETGQTYFRIKNWPYFRPDLCQEKNQENTTRKTKRFLEELELKPGSYRSRWNRVPCYPRRTVKQIPGCPVNLFCLKVMKEYTQSVGLCLETDGCPN